MAKKKDNDDIILDDEDKKGSRIVTVLIILGIVIVWLVVFAVLVRLDVGGFGSKILRPVLKDVPVISKILPPASEEELAKENNYSYKSIGEAEEKIKQLEAQVNQLSESNKADTDTIAGLQAEVARLKVFEDNQTAFEKREKEFDEKVVFNDKALDIEEYKKFYEGINKENADEIYRQVLEQIQYDDKVKTQADAYAKMDPAAAAKILQVMTGDLNLVVQYLSCMSTSKSSLIMENMEPEFAAQVSKLMLAK